MPKKIPVLITLSPAALQRGETTLAELQRQGLEVVSNLPALGILTGRIAEAKMPVISKIMGITVERDQTIQLAPPDAEVK